MKRIILVFTAALLLAAMTVAVSPAMAQEEKKKEEEKKKKEMPKSGGFDVGTAAFLGLGATVLLVGAGLLVRRSRR